MSEEPLYFHKLFSLNVVLSSRGGFTVPRMKCGGIIVQV